MDGPRGSNFKLGRLKVDSHILRKVVQTLDSKGLKLDGLPKWTVLKPESARSLNQKVDGPNDKTVGISDFEYGRGGPKGVQKVYFLSMYFFCIFFVPFLLSSST